MKTTAQEVKAVIEAFRQNNAGGAYSFCITRKKVVISITKQSGEVVTVFRAEMIGNEWVGGYTDNTLA